MPALFSAFEDELSDAIDGFFGEQVRVLPMRQATVNSRREADPDRAEAEVTAVIDDRTPGAASFARLNAGGGRGAGGGPDFTVTNPMLFLDERRLGALGRPRRLDRVKRLETGDVYEICDVQPDGQGRLKCALAKVKVE